MMYPYMTLADETEIIHSQIIHKNGKDFVEVHFEKPIENGFCSARCSLPDYKWLFNNGYSEEDISYFTKFLKNNAHLLYEFAKIGGFQNA
ncbi:MAG: hypothetical protein IKO19_13655 [Candidatus Riflebacteria bacterium]|nr:hypothetical protein [Candidatus Riflebacteria bacterium]